LLVPPNTPEATVRRLRDEVAKAVNAPDVLAQFAVQGMLPVTSVRAMAPHHQCRARTLEQSDQRGRLAK